MAKSPRSSDFGCRNRQRDPSTVGRDRCRRSGGRVVLRRFKTRFFTNGVTTCPFPLLQIDTDRETLTSLKLSGEDAGLSVEETLSIPLRTSNEYRSASELELSWLSRRWLFNIPRSGKVEGIRPLGRLALCNHRKSVESRFRQVIKETLSVEFRETVSGLVELPLATEGVDVYVVAATTGGTSSGTLADIGLIVKNVLRASGIKGGEVHGILLHGTGTARDANDVHEANTVCVLRELRHLSTPGLGTDRGFEKAGVQADVAPFDHTSLVHLGDSLNADVFDRRACDVADHLFVGATTAAQLDFREWRQSFDDEANGTPQLRLLGLDSQEAAALNVASEEAGNLTKLVLRRWAGTASSAATDTQHELPPELTDTQTLLDELNLTAESLPQQVVTLLRDEIGKNIQTYTAEVNGQLQATCDVASLTHGQALTLLSGQISQRGITDATDLHGIISDVHNKLNGVTSNCKSALRKHLRQLLDTPHRLEGALAATMYTRQSLTKAQRSCEELLSKIEGAFQILADDTQADVVFASESAVQDFSQQYCILLAYQTIHQCFVNHVKTISTLVATVAEEFKTLQGNIETLAAQLSASSPESDSIPQPVVDAFDRSLRTSVPKFLFDSCTEVGRADVFSTKLIKAAKRFLVSAGDIGTEGASEPNLKEFPESAWPFFRKIGGRRRVLGTIPNGMDTREWKQTLSKEFGNCVAVRESSHQQVSVVCEFDGIPLESVLSCLTGSNPHSADVADRIHTRVDIDW